MKAKTSAVVDATQAPWNLLSSAGQQQAVAATECATAMFRGFEEMRKVQEQAAHASAERHAIVANKLKAGCGPGDLLAMQVELLQFDIDGVTRYWRQLGAAALEMQTRMMGSYTQLVDNDTLLEAAAAIDRATGREAAAAHA